MRLKLLQLWLSCQRGKQEDGEKGNRGRVKGERERGKRELEKGKGQWKTNCLSLYPFPFYPVFLFPFLRGFTFQQRPAGWQDCGGQQYLDDVAGKVRRYGELEGDG